jgi:pyruvate,orthophosphate dikinase
VATALTGEQLQELCERYLQLVLNHTGQPFPSDAQQQLQTALAVLYQHHADSGLAISVFASVFDNMGDDCATGYVVSRDPTTGENEWFGEYWVNAHCEEVMAGMRTSKPIHDLQREMPNAYRQLQTLRQQLESHYQAVIRFDFTIERGVLYCQRASIAELTPAATVRTSIEMAKSGLISKGQAVLRIQPEALDQLLHPQLQPHHQNPLAQGLPASPGAAFGVCAFDADTAVRLAKSGETVILVREETKPEDIHGFFAAKGILTSRGGKTSHAAVTARGMGKACVAGADAIKIDVRLRQAMVGDIHLKEGDRITLDGCNGAIYLGTIAIVPPAYSDELKTLLEWADDIARLQVYANVDAPETARLALKYGAKGIGLCRTERMFNAADRLPLVTDVILAENTAQREAALSKLFPIQRDDFLQLFEAMSPHPVTVRLLDPPMHEFLPQQHQLEADIAALKHYRTQLMGQRITLETLSHTIKLPPALDYLNEERVTEAIAHKQRMLAKVLELHEINPMLGHRGVRLGMSYPEIYHMQIRSILEAAARCLKQRLPIQPEIMVPQVFTAQEIKLVKQWVADIQHEVEEQYRVKLKLTFGTMIETVRACTRADSLAEQVDFFSFGTNDLTQATFSCSREDAENKFLPIYEALGLLQDNPFENLDRLGVGKLMEMAVGLGRKQHPHLRIGICGEHGGHPRSIAFCHELGLDYVSCSAPRIPVARLAAAQAQLRQPRMG